MFFTDGKLQYRVRVERPDPIFARALQQAIGGVEGEIRVMMQYLFQAWGQRGPKKYRDMLLATGTEEIGHIEMLSTAVALNLEGAPLSLQEDGARNPMVHAALGGMNLRHVLSTGLAATPDDANGVPFDASHVYASGWEGGVHRGDGGAVRAGAAARASSADRRGPDRSDGREEPDGQGEERGHVKRNSITSPS